MIRIGIIKTTVIPFFFSMFLSCHNSLMNKAYEEHERFIGKDGWRYKVDSDIHKYNATHDTALLYNTLAYLENLPSNDCDIISWHTRKLTVLRLLHKYDAAFAVLDTCPDGAWGNFGKMKELLITEISKYNHYHKFEERDRKIDELISYMEYCFERQEMAVHKAELQYLQKYKDNQLALDAVATEIDPYTLNWYIGARLLRGDKKTEMDMLIEEYYQKGLIDKVGKDWLRTLLDGEYEEKDFDSQL